MKNSKFIKTLVSIIVVLALVLTIFWLLIRPKEVVYQGRIEATEVYLSAKIPSRLKSIEVNEGASVKKGQLLATLESPEIEAREVQVLAINDAATAMKDKAVKGARPEEISAAKNVYEKAQAASTVMQKTYKRIENLYKDGVVSEQKLDETFAQKEAALRDERAALNQYQIALKAVRVEDLAAASAKEEEAKGALQELEVYLDERSIVANLDAEVLDFLPEEGELIGAGYPVVHLVDLKSAYAILNVKETALSKFQKDSEFKATIPALDNKEVTFKIYYVSALGDFATWNATKSTGEFDIRTFEIKALPLDKEVLLRPGMSILVDDSQF